MALWIEKSNKLLAATIISFLLFFLPSPHSIASNRVCWFETVSKIVRGPDGEFVRMEVTPVEHCFDLDSLGGGSSWSEDWNSGPDLGGGEVGEQVQQQAVDPCNKSNPVTSQPVLIATGVKIKPEVDFPSSGSGSIGLGRLYLKSQAKPGAFGQKWSSSIDYSLTFVRGLVECAGKLSGGTTCPTSDPITQINAYRASGAPVLFTPATGGTFTDNSGGTIAPSGTNWILTTAEGGSEAFDDQGRPLYVRDSRGVGISYSYSNGAVSSITHTSGRSLAISWSAGKISTVSRSDGKVFAYAYNGQGYLASVTYPDSLGVRGYLYEDSAQPGGLTGITVNGGRYSKYTYYPDGRVSSSGLGPTGLVDRSQFSYAQDHVDVTNSAGQTIRHQLGEIAGRKYVIGIERPASAACPAGGTYTAYDERGNVDYSLDAKGVRTNFSYDAFDRLTLKVAGIGPNGEQDQVRLTQYVWDQNFRTRLLKVIYFGSNSSQPIKEVSYDYYPSGHVAENLLRYVSEVNRSSVGTAFQARIISYGYSFHANGMLATAVTDGVVPGTGDQVIRQYATSGDLTSVSNSLGHTTSYSQHHWLGMPGQIVGANSDQVTFTYDALGRQLSQTQSGGGRNALTVYVRDAFGNVSRRTDPSGRVTDFQYNLLGALTSSVTSKPATGMDFSEDGKIYSSQTIVYGTNGKPTYFQTARHWYEYVQNCNPECGPIGPEDPPGELQMMIQVTRTQARVYDASGLLASQQGNAGQNFRFLYDANGDLIQVKDSIDRATTYVYDRHRRLTEIHEPGGAITRYGYDPLDRIISVTDRVGAQTSFSYDGIDQLWSTTSADTGTTTFHYNHPGIPAYQVRADGSSLSYQYDDLGRLTWYGNSVHGRSYTYDTCTYGKGRLCGTNTNVAGGLITNFSYYAQGEVHGRQDWTPYSNTITTDTYDQYGRKTAITYPDGTAVGYGYVLDSPTVVTVNSGGVSNLISDVGYEPYGDANTWTYGNGLQRHLQFDSDGRITSLATAISWNSNLQKHAYTYNSLDELTRISDGVTGTYREFEYDVGGRLNKQGSSPSSYSLYGYDANGGRTVESGASPGVLIPPTYLQIDPSANRVTSFGATTYTNSAIGRRTSAHLPGVYAHNYLYDAFGRLAQVDAYNGSGFSAVGSYGYNALDQRVVKTAGASTTRFVYGHLNQLVAENKDGVWTNYIWLNGELVGLTRSGQKLYIHGDRQGRPELVTNAAKAVVWRAINTAFDRYVSVDSIGGLNIGFPGQYFDAESKLWSNGYRDYDSATGRYIQPDPIGLNGGLNPYSYAGSSPTNYVDPSGLLTVRAYVGRGRGYGNEWSFVLEFNPLSIKDIPGIGGQVRKGINRIEGAIQALKPDGVGPRRPFKDVLECGELDALLAEYYEKQGYKPGEQLTRQEAEQLLNGMYEGFPEMRQLYDPPGDMLDAAQESGIGNWVNSLYEQAYPGQLK